MLALTAAVALVAGGIGGVVGDRLGDDGEASVAAGGQQVQRPADSVAGIAARAVPSVLTIKVSAGESSGTGTGWVWDDKGHIVTNNHVIDQAADGKGRIIVELASGNRRDAELVGRDASYDLAVLKVDPMNLKPLPVGRSTDVVVGDEVIAVGSPLGLGSSVTSGIVSALERPVTAGQEGSESFISAIQTDAAINPGNSGGPLLNTAGQVIGVNSAIAQMPGQASASGSIGVGFAIPSDVVGRTVEQLISTGKAVHPIIGVNLDTRYEGEGARVLEDGQVQGGQAVVPDGPAASAGIEPGDVITDVDGQRVSNANHLIVKIRAKAVGDTVTLKVRRGDEEKELTMTLEAAKE